MILSLTDVYVEQHTRHFKPSENTTKCMAH